MPLSLALKPHATFLSLEIANHATQTEKIWELWNSWGWRTISLQVRKEEEAQIVFITPTQNREWTMNFPSFIEIAPKTTHELKLMIDHEWWEATQDLSILKDHPFLVKAVLDIPESPEAGEYGVFVGKIESDWVSSQPPHRWLFPENALNSA